MQHGSARRSDGGIVQHSVGQLPDRGGQFRSERRVGEQSLARRRNAVVPDVVTRPIDNYKHGGIASMPATLDGDLLLRGLRRR